jgi:glycosyltransferase involved in cell wall biosynthesis
MTAGGAANRSMPLSFSIVTPSYKQPDWLRLCARSVADQAGPGIEIEHIVQDSLSGPEIAEVTRPFPSLRLVSEKDEGMYDAINRGWRKARGDILCWLNCDEQYLPGALRAVADYFNAHPEVDLVFADAIIVDGESRYLCSRQVLTPHLYHTWTCHLQTFSCSTFFRGSLIRERGFLLDPRWRAAGDADLILRMARAGTRMGHLPRYTSTFVDTGENLGLRPFARQEHEDLMRQAPRWVQVLRPAWKVLHRLRRLVNGQYAPKPFSYDIYTPASPAQRVHFEVAKPTFYWATRMK